MVAIVSDKAEEISIGRTAGGRTLESGNSIITDMADSGMVASMADSYMVDRQQKEDIHKQIFTVLP